MLLTSKQAKEMFPKNKFYGDVQIVSKETTPLKKNIGVAATAVIPEFTNPEEEILLVITAPMIDNDGYDVTIIKTNKDLYIDLVTTHNEDDGKSYKPMEIDYLIECMKERAYCNKWVDKLKKLKVKYA